MKILIHKTLKSVAAVAAAGALLTACNKTLPSAEPIATPAPAGNSILETIRADQANYSILDSAIKRAGAGAIARYSDRSASFTFFAPTNAAFAISGLPNVTALGAFRPGQLDTILSYHTVPGIRLLSDSIRTTFPNMQLPTGMVLAPPSASLPPGLRASVFASRRGAGAWVNNIPITQANALVANGVVHRIAAVLLPPTQTLWGRINTDASLTYLRAAVVRADSGSAAASTLQGALDNPAANLTVFAPNDAAFRALLVGQITVALIPVITQQLINGGLDPATAAAQAPAQAQAAATALAATPAVFTNPQLATVLTPTVVRGLVAYHVFGVRAFSVNLPTTTTNLPTLLNGSIPAHPGVGVTATFGATGVTAITVKGAANATASNVAVNPSPGATSDQNFVNGVLHVIDQVLRPQ